MSNGCGSADSRTVTVQVLASPYDLDGSGTADAQDLVWLGMYLAGALFELPCGPGCGDFDHDGAVTARDLVEESLAVL